MSRRRADGVLVPVAPTGGQESGVRGVDAWATVSDGHGVLGAARCSSSAPVVIGARCTAPCPRLVVGKRVVKRSAGLTAFTGRAPRASRTIATRRRHVGSDGVRPRPPWG